MGNFSYINIEDAIQSESNVRGNMYRDSVYFQKYKLKDILAYTANTDIFLIESNCDKKMNREINLIYKNKSDSSFIDRKVINKHLMDLYNYKMTGEFKSINIWKLVIEDSLKLMPYRADSTSGGYIRYSKDSAIIYRQQLSRIAFAIQKSKSKRVLMKDNIEERYNIKLNTTDSIEFKKQLTSIYGLKLVDSTANIQHLIIDFKNKK